MYALHHRRDYEVIVLELNQITCVSFNCGYQVFSKFGKKSTGDVQCFVIFILLFSLLCYQKVYKVVHRVEPNLMCMFLRFRVQLAT